MIMHKASFLLCSEILTRCVTKRWSSGSLRDELPPEAKAAVEPTFLRVILIAFLLIGLAGRT